MNNLYQITEMLLAIIIIFTLVVWLLSITYDLKQIRLANSRGRKKLPTLTVLVQSSCNESVLPCLDSMRRCRIKKCDVVIIDYDKSQKTHKAIDRYINKYPRFELRYCPAGLGEDDPQRLLEKGYRQSQKGEIVLVLRGTSTVSSRYLSANLRLFSDSSINALQTPILYPQANSLTTLFHRFVTQYKAVWCKTLSLLSMLTIKPDEGVFVRSVFFKGLSNPIKAKWASGQYISSELINDDVSAVKALYLPDKKNIAFTTILSVFVALVVLYLQTFAFYSAAALSFSLLLIIGWLMVAVCTFVVAWSSSEENINTKIKLTFMSPLMYFLLYINLFIFVVSSTLRAETWSAERNKNGQISDFLTKS